MSPELLKIYSGIGYWEFIPEKNDIFSLGLTFLIVNLIIIENNL